jgi:hypothetical protein
MVVTTHIEYSTDFHHTQWLADRFIDHHTYTQEKLSGSSQNSKRNQPVRKLLKCKFWMQNSGPSDHHLFFISCQHPWGPFYCNHVYIEDEITISGE